ncbi:MAG: hypothetical protein ACKVU4_15290 [Phycisphaerales bacterium]
MPATDAHPDDDSALIAWAATRDASCPVCGYNLRGVPRAVCPECAARLHLQVGSENLAIGPWALAVIALSLAIGFDGVVALLMCVMTAFNPPRTGGAMLSILEILGSFLALAAVCGGGLTWLVRRRRSTWNRIARARQWKIAWAVFVAVGLVHALFGLGLAQVLD